MTPIKSAALFAVLRTQKVISTDRHAWIEHRIVFMYTKFHVGGNNNVTRNQTFIQHEDLRVI